MSPSVRKVIAGAVAAGVVATIALVAVPRAAETWIERRLLREATRHEWTVSAVHAAFSWTGPVRLSGLLLLGPGDVTVRAEEIAVDWGLAWAAPRIRPTGITLAGVRIRLPSGLVVESARTEWEIGSLTPSGARLARRGGRGTIFVQRGADGRSVLELADVDLSREARVTRDGKPLLLPGVFSGRVEVSGAAGGGIALDVIGSTRGLQLASLGGDEDAPAFGAPVDAEVTAQASVWPKLRRLEAPCFRVRASGVELDGSLVLETAPDDAAIDVDLDVPRVGFAEVLAASGLRRPDVLDGAGEDLGSASLSFALTGRLADPASLEVDERLDFRAPRKPVPGLADLNGPFFHTVLLRDGTECRVEVSPASNDYVALDDVPPLFVRALLISEDAGFYGHHGIDLKEIPVAFATNLARGEKAFGASTISQQVAKNLFLSREKSLSRKVREAALTLLLEAHVGKKRILEIYLNVIEWGPDLRGLRPAARRYFGKEPRDLSVKEGAFLICLIPGPVKYQKSFASGTPSPGFLRLVNGLLAKLRSIGALTDGEYEAALAEPLAIGSGTPVPRAGENPVTP